MLKLRLASLLAIVVLLLSAPSTNAQVLTLSEEFSLERKPRKGWDVYEIDDKAIVVTWGQGLGSTISRLSYRIFDAKSLELLTEVDDLEEIEFEDEDCEFIETKQFGNQLCFFYVQANEDINQTRLIIRLLDSDGTFSEPRVLHTAPYNDDLDAGDYWFVLKYTHPQTQSETLILREELQEAKDGDYSRSFVLFNDLQNPDPIRTSIRFKNSDQKFNYDIVLVTDSEFAVLGTKTERASGNAGLMGFQEAEYTFYKVNFESGDQEMEDLQIGSKLVQSNSEANLNYTVEGIFMLPLEAYDPETAELGYFTTGIDIESMQSFAGNFTPVPKSFTDGRNYSRLTMTTDNVVTAVYSNHYMTDMDYASDGSVYVTWAKMDIDFKEGGFFTSSNVEKCEHTDILIQKYDIEGVLLWENEIDRELTNLKGNVAMPQVLVYNDLPTLVYYDWEANVDYRLGDSRRPVANDFDEGDRGYFFFTQFDANGKALGTQVLSRMKEYDESETAMEGMFFAHTFYWQSPTHAYDIDGGGGYTVRLGRIDL